jgi:hypothetical protein
MRRWCKRFVKTPDGRYCILGALQAAHADKELTEPIMPAISQVTGRSQWIDRFNDHPLTTHADILKVLQQARENMTKERVGAWVRLHQVFCKRR